MMQQQPQQMMPEEMPDGEVQATEQEQEMLEQAFALAIEMIHGEGQSGDAIAQTVLQSQDISEGIGNATATVIIGVEKRAGGLPDDLKLALAQEVIAELSGLAVEAGALAEDEVDDSFIDAVVSHAYSEYLTMKEAMGELDPAELEASVTEAEQEMGVSTRNQQQAQSQQPQQAPQQGAGLLGI
jgi:hypothetical protein